MKNDELLEKLSHHKKFLFIIPNLIYIYGFLYYYNKSFQSYSSTGEVLFYEVIILSVVFLIINSIIYLLLKKSLKDYHKLFLVMCIISGFYFIKMNILNFFIYILCILIFVFILKKFIHFQLDKIVIFLSFVVLFLVFVQVITSIHNGISVLLKFKKYHYKMEIQVKENMDTPNIYWIHCDGMMNFYDMKKYFNFKDSYFQDYLKRNHYSYNEKASLIVGHRTQSALVALFNPYYYDHFFKDYLMELQDNFIHERDSSFMVNFYELEEKRLNNELFQALKKKDYTTIAIADFNQYTGFYTDYFYDFYTYDTEGKQVTDKQEFRYMDNHNMTKKDQFKLLSFMRFNHFKTLLDKTILYPTLENVNYLDYEVVPYQEEDISESSYTDKSNYWISKAILSGIHDSLDIKDKKFVFIDFKLNHLPITFNAYGDFLLPDNQLNLGYYSSNYSYSTKLLVEILDYIRKNDENAMIVIQGDHGLHMLEDDLLRNYFGVSQEELQEVRNSVISAYYIPEKYQNGDEKYLDNPLNISRYLVNNYIGNNYEYIG